MAADERDARLILRAEDRATKTFEAVSKSVKDLNRDLVAQAKSAAAGEGSLEDLTRTLKALNDAGDDLVRQQSAIKAFERIGVAAEKANERVERSTKAYDEYKARLDAAGKTTDAQANRLERLGLAVEKAAANLDKQNRSLDAAKDRLTGLGLAADRGAEQFQAINTVAEQVAVGASRATEAINGFAGAQARAASEAKALAAAEAETAAVIAREAATATSQETQRRAALLASSREVLAGNAALEASFAELAREQAELTKVNALRQIGQEAVAASTNLNRFAQTGEAATAGLTRLADAVRQIVTPTLSSVQTLDGAISQIDKSADLAARKQKARVSQYQDSLNQLKEAQAALLRQATAVDTFSKQTVALDKLDVELGIAAARYEELGHAAAAAEAPSDRLAKELKEAGDELERVGARALTGRKAFVELQDGLKRAGVDTDNLADELVRLETAARKSAVVADTLTTKVGGNGKGFLGLKAYELQNLSFQINDIFTSLASGISPTQTLAQQGGQIVQIFPQILTGALRLLPVLLPIGVAFGAIAYQISQANKQATAIKGFDSLFTLSGNAAGLSAEQFGKAQIALEGVGVKADDAAKALRTFIDAGLNPAGLDDFLTTVRAIAQATGEDVPAAADKYAAALSGGYDQVVALNDITHTLNDTQLEQIQRLFDSGKAEEARTKVAEAYRAKAQEIADKSQSDWSKAIAELSQAVSGLSNAFGLTEGASVIAQVAMKAVARVARETAQDIRTLTGVVKGFYALNQASRGDTAGAAGTLKGLFSSGEPRSSQAIPAATPYRRTSSGGQVFLREQQTALKNAKELTREQRLQVAAQDAVNAAAKAGATDAEIRQARANALRIEQGKIDKENAAASNKAASAARSAESKAATAARAAEARQSRIDALTKDLENTYESLGANKADDPFKAIQVKADQAVRNIRAKFADLAKLGVTSVGGKTVSQFEAQVKAAADLETVQARQKQNEEDVNKLLEQRKIVLAGIEDRVSSGALTPTQGVEQATAAAATLDAQIGAAAKKALDFNVNLRTATFDPKLEASIASLQNVLQGSSGTENAVQVALRGLKEAQANVDALVARRDAVVELQNTLVKAGLKAPADAQRTIKTAFDDSRDSILVAADAVDALIARILAIPGIPPALQASLVSAQAGIAGVRAGTEHLDEDIVALNNAATQALAGALSDFITDIGNNVGVAISGAQSLGDTLSNIGRSALNFAAQFTKAIAQAIIQLIALKVAKAAVAAIGLHQGGVVGATRTFSRKVPAEVFAGAIRYHTGGLVGLRPDETPAILQKGEEVITRADPRHRANGGKGGGGQPAPVTIKNINLFDPGDAVSAGANTLHGEQAILNVVRRNAQAVKAAIGPS